jgi:GT2 family glycosyltransferase
MMPFWRPETVLQVQCVVYNTAPEAIRCAAVSVARASELAIGSGACARVSLRYGDGSPTPCLDEAALAELQQAHRARLAIDYDFFHGNLGSARGHNRLASAMEADFTLVLNPDVVVSPRTIETLLGCFKQPGVGMAEAKQLPIEHPKEYDATTGETSWASTACAMIPTPLFNHLGGFDADSFFLYGDDVDFSWMVRQAGFRVIFQPAAVAFHDKRLSPAGQWQPTVAERYYSAESALVLAHKWSRPDLVREYLDDFTASGDADMARAVRSFEQMRTEGRLPRPLDPEHRIGQFVNSSYARHRFAL